MPSPIGSRSARRWRAASRCRRSTSTGGALADGLHAFDWPPELPAGAVGGPLLGLFFGGGALSLIVMLNSRKDAFSLGHSALVALAVVVLMLPLEALVARRQARYTANLMAARDVRVRAAFELLQGVRLGLLIDLKAGDANHRQVLCLTRED